MWWEKVKVEFLYLIEVVINIKQVVIFRTSFEFTTKKKYVIDTENFKANHYKKSSNKVKQQEKERQNNCKTY